MIKERSEILAHYDFIDRIIIFDEKTPLILLKNKTAISFKGDDYKISQVGEQKKLKDGEEKWF